MQPRPRFRHSVPPVAAKPDHQRSRCAGRRKEATLLYYPPSPTVAPTTTRTARPSAAAATKAEGQGISSRPARP